MTENDTASEGPVAVTTARSTAFSQIHDAIQGSYFDPLFAKGDVHLPSLSLAGRIAYSPYVATASIFFEQVLSDFGDIKLGAGPDGYQYARDVTVALGVEILD